MKKMTLLALFCGAMLTASAQRSLDLSSRAALRQMRLEQRQGEQSAYSRRLQQLGTALGVKSNHVMGMVRLADGYTEAELTAAGVQVLRSRYGFAFVALPIDKVEQIAALPSVRALQVARPSHPHLKAAREASGVAKIHQGLGLEQAYTGRGVVCGIVDQGTDPNHINFKNADGTSRVGMVAHVTVNEHATSADDLIRTKFYDRSTVQNFTTDSKTSYHGTHTMGIMAGGYNGDSQVAVERPGGVAEVVTQANPYYGVAYGSDVAVAACGTLIDEVIAYGVDFLIQYAQETQQPYVINISIGSNSGSHDARSTICRFFDYCASEANAIICLSAGNEGDMKLAAAKTLTATDNELKTFIEGYDATLGGNPVYARQGSVSIYSDSEKPFEIQGVIYNKRRNANAALFNFTIDPTAEGGAKYWVSSKDYKEDDSDVIHSTLGRYFEGYIGLAWSYDYDTNNFYALVDCYAVNDTLNNADGNYIIGFIAKGQEGQKLHAYCDGTFAWLSNNNIAGWDDGSYNGTISDMACGLSTISVGSYDTSDHWAALDGGLYKANWNPVVGHVSSFSSYGTLADGRNLPLVLAPGAVIMSSSNTHYVNAGYGNKATSGATAKGADGTTYYWENNSGTSMASPYVAGSIALWLEADPSLTVADVQDIIAQTAVIDDDLQGADPVQVGAGKFDAYAGLKEVLRRRAQSGVREAQAAGSRLVVSQRGERMVSVFLPGANALQVEVFSLAGVPVLRGEAQGDEALLDVSSLQRGSYVIRVNGKLSKCFVLK